MVYALNLNLLSLFGKIPTRFYVAIMLFAASFVSYMLRVTFSIVIIKMTKTNATAIEEHHVHDDDTFDWDKKTQGLLLSAYFYGYIFPNLLGGSLAEIFGARKVIFVAIFFSSIVTALSPFSANDNFVYMFIMRLILGILAGFLYPASHQLISKWAPIDEKGKFVFTLMGGIFGTVVSWPLAGFLVENYGWRMGFHIPAAIGFLISFLWLYFVHDSPQKHPRIDKGEKELIEKSIGSSSSSKKAWPPLQEILKSSSFYALMVLHFGGTFGLFFLITAAPKFMSEVLKFNLTEAGILASLPYLARLIFGFIFGSVGDELKQKNVLSTTALRKSFCLFSHIIPGIFLISLCFAGSNPYLCVTIITLSLGFNGAATMTNLQNSQDLAPNFAGQVYGIVNFVGTMSGFVSPLIVAHFTQENSTMNEWFYIFLIGGIVYILSALFFIAFGSGEVQKWNDVNNENDVRVT